MNFPAEDVLIAIGKLVFARDVGLPVLFAARDEADKKSTEEEAKYDADPNKTASTPGGYAPDLYVARDLREQIEACLGQLRIVGLDGFAQPQDVDAAISAKIKQLLNQGSAPAS